MLTIRTSEEFRHWLRHLPDRRAVALIQVRLRRLQFGNPGDWRPVGGGISELRINYGPGYRVYYMYQGQQLIIILAAGMKSSQANDIRRAQQMARTIRI